MKFVTLAGQVIDQNVVRDLVYGTPGHVPVVGEMDLLNDPVSNPDDPCFIGIFHGYLANGEIVSTNWSQPKTYREVLEIR